MDEKEALSIFYKHHAILLGHFVYNSGKHGRTYVNKDIMEEQPKDIAYLCLGIAKHFQNDHVDAVVAPEKGGIILSQWTGFYLSIPAFYAEKTVHGDFVFKRGSGMRFLPDKKVLVVEDVLTTGGSVKKVVAAVRALGGVIRGVGALWNRGGVTARNIDDVPKLCALINQRIPEWDAADCPLCEKGIPINTDIGHGREFLQRKKRSA